MARAYKQVNGVRCVQCSSCLAFKPATKEHFYFQGKGGCRGPHSWCKPCYATNSGRAPGMRPSTVPEAPPMPEHAAAVEAAAGFLRIAAQPTQRLVGALL